MKAAIELNLMPSRVRALRDAPLPDGVQVVLRIAAGDTDAEREATAIVDRPVSVVRDASAFFIEQLLLHPEADSYRVLGAERGSSPAELRQNMALLMRWLHPDKNPSEERAVFVNRVNRAWDDLKTPERRDAYDRMLASRTVRPRLAPSTAGRRGGAPGSIRTHHAPGATHRKRQLLVSDLLGPVKAGRVGLLRRLFSFLLRRKR